LQSATACQLLDAGKAKAGVQLAGIFNQPQLGEHWSVFDVFSRRPRPTAPARLKPRPAEFRNRVLMLCRDRFGAPAAYAIAPTHIDEFLAEMHGRLTYLLGRSRLSNADGAPVNDLSQFLIECNDDQFLDFVESIFRLDCYRRACPDEQTMVDDINHLLELDDLPYALTPFAHETGTGYLMGHAIDGVRWIVAYPQVIMRDQQVAYAEAIAPALALLADVGFSAANEEFRGALEDYRKGRYRECLTKCGSAFESAMKLICDRRQ
jgi:hypothetical protein